MEGFLLSILRNIAKKYIVNEAQHLVKELATAENTCACRNTRIYPMKISSKINHNRLNKKFTDCADFFLCKNSRIPLIYHV